MKLANADPDLLAAAADRGFLSLIEMINPDITMLDGHLIRKGQLGIKWKRTIDADERV